jgi:hypothetical protein
MRDFLGSGDTWIKSKDIAEIEMSIRELEPRRIKFSQWANRETDLGSDNWYEEKGALWIWKEAVDGRSYTIGADAAEGHGEVGDNSCFQVIDDISCEQVAEFYSNTIPAHIFAKTLSEIGIYYNNAKIIAENLSPAGGAVVSALQNTHSYENLWYDTSTRTKVPKAGLKTNTQNRGEMLARIYERILERSLKLNSPRLIDEFKHFVFNAVRNKPEAESGFHDDAIMALAIAIYARDMAVRDIPVGAEVPKELLDAYTTQTFGDINIRQEIRDGAPEDWLKDEEEDFFSNEDIVPGVVFNTKRKYDRLLKEFDW